MSASAVADLASSSTAGLATVRALVLCSGRVFESQLSLTGALLDLLIEETSRGLLPQRAGATWQRMVAVYGRLGELGCQFLRETGEAMLAGEQLLLEGMFPKPAVWEPEPTADETPAAATAAAAPEAGAPASPEEMTARSERRRGKGSLPQEA
ncbi:hypothetical protein HRbin40_02249 [bacterium HR40]|nr:hypothetical protein HRbin40_02249 [bacterium HR40]